MNIHKQVTLSHTLHFWHIVFICLLYGGTGNLVQRQHRACPVRPDTKIRLRALRCHVPLVNNRKKKARFGQLFKPSAVAECSLLNRTKVFFLTQAAVVLNHLSLYLIPKWPIVNKLLLPLLQIFVYAVYIGLLQKNMFIK